MKRFNTIAYLFLVLLGGDGLLFSQNKTADSGHGQADSHNSPMGGNSKYLGKDIPYADLASGNLIWDSKAINVYNNQVVRARFEKYLNAPEATSEEDKAYQEIITNVLTMLTPRSATVSLTSTDLDKAWQQLPKASKFRQDAHLCDNIATMVYTVWQSKKESDRLMNANVSLQRELEQAQWNLSVSTDKNLTKLPDSHLNAAQADSWKTDRDFQRQFEQEPLKLRVDEIKQTYQTNRTKNELTKIQAKMEFQTLIIQLFMQRRFQHVLIASRFYRAVFDDGDTTISDLKAIAEKLGDKDAPGVVMDVGAKGGPASGGGKVRHRTGSGSNNSDSENSGTGSSSSMESDYSSNTGGNFAMRNLDANSIISGGARGLQAMQKLLTSMNQLDALSNEAIRDVEESLDTVNYLMEQNELKSASERLMEAFFIGENLPPIRVFSREKKRKVLDFTRKANSLLAKIEVRDYGKAEELLKEIEGASRDFESSKVNALIQSQKVTSNMHLAKAKASATAGQKDQMEQELQKATEIWPTNPDLNWLRNFDARSISKDIVAQTDLQQNAFVDLDRLLRQKAYREIYDDKVRFIAATATDPSKQKKLQEVLDMVFLVEAKIKQAEELAKRGDAPGAWETLEKVSSVYPDDSLLNQARAKYTTEASDFVRSLRTGDDLEKKGQFGSSLSWYLKAQKLYPPSEFARDSINRLVKTILPEGGA